MGRGSKEEETGKKEGRDGVQACVALRIFDYKHSQYKNEGGRKGGREIE